MNTLNDLQKKLNNLFYGYGLDFGTFRSMMAYNNASHSSPQIAQYENPITRNGIPSLFWYSSKNNEEYLCEQVIQENGLFDDPQGVCTSIKMKMDTPSIVLNGKSFKTTYIAEKEIRRILSLSHEAFQKSLFTTPTYQKLVVGIPVRFGAVKKQTLLNVLKQATNHKEIVFLPEPIAAALTYSHFLKQPLQKILVFDLGAGTFDTVLLIPNRHRTNENPYKYKALYPDGLELAGDYFDSKMIELILETLRATPSNLDIRKLSNPNTADYQRLKNVARDIKEHLSNANSNTQFIEGTDIHANPCIQKVTIYKKDFENKIREALSKAVNCAYNVLRQANAQTDPNIDILLVGGSTYIPLVRTMIEEKFSHINKSHIHQKFPEQAIALGCALYANDQESSDTPMAYAYAIGTHKNNQEVLDIKIPSNVKRPYKITANYWTKNPNQTDIHFLFFEVEHGEKDTYLNVDEGNPTPLLVKHSFRKQVPERTKVELTLELSENGTLIVTINDFGITPIDKQQLDISNVYPK